VLTLGIETATKVCSVALCDGVKPLASYEVNMGMTHSEGLLPQIAQMLERSGVAKKDLELIAVSRGPGSFTGLRIGLATAEALAYGLKLPMIAVSTTETLAYNLPIPGLLLACVLDAQKGNYYLALYKWKVGKLVEVKPVTIMPGKEIFNMLTAYKEPTVLLGECNKLAQACTANVTVAPQGIRLPKAMAVAMLGASQHKEGADTDYFGTEPFYIRRSEAEELWEQRQKQK